MPKSFLALNADALAKIDKALFNASKQNVLDEQVQMTRLLESLSRTDVLEYPVKVRHTGNTSIPDFQIESATRRIAVEITKVAVDDVEHARALQRTQVNATLSVSTLYRSKGKPRKKAEVIQEAFCIPALSYPISIQEHHDVWIQQATQSLKNKSDILTKKEFMHGDEDWLVLWDLIGTADWELQKRIAGLQRILADRWKPGWFSRVVVQDQHFFWQLMFTPSGCIQLPTHRN